jgi:hypothetical protein
MEEALATVTRVHSISSAQLQTTSQVHQTVGAVYVPPPCPPLLIVTPPRTASQEGPS